MCLNLCKAFANVRWSMFTLHAMDLHVSDQESKRWACGPYCATLICLSLEAKWCMPVVQQPDVESSRCGQQLLPRQQRYSMEGMPNRHLTSFNGIQMLVAPASSLMPAQAITNRHSWKLVECFELQGMMAMNMAQPARLKLHCCIRICCSTAGQTWAGLP